MMVGRNDPCPCGSGKKYKKCCDGKEAVTVEVMQAEEIERILQKFYDDYPKKEDVSNFVQIANEMKEKLCKYIEEEQIEAIALDEFFFHKRPDIWLKYVEKAAKTQVRSSVQEILKTWKEPRILLGQVASVEEQYAVVNDLFSTETIQLRRESEKPISIGAFVYCFILPDGTNSENHYLAISSLIFIPEEFEERFTTFVKAFSKSTDSFATYWQNESIHFWESLGTAGYAGDEFTQFEASVIEALEHFLEEHHCSSAKLLEVVEDYLVELQPKARKQVAIAAGAVRFGMEAEFIPSVKGTLKEIAAYFDVSSSSMNKYYKEMLQYYESRIN